VGGALRYNSGAFWPYRFITSLWQQIYDEHRPLLSIETNTPVLDIEFDAASQKYFLTTSRGAIVAKKIIHATNGYAGHLLPGLRGKIFPIRGYMSAQEPCSEFGHFARDRTWSFCGEALLNIENGTQSSAIYYGNQSPNDRVIFWGSDTAPIHGIMTADDSVIPDVTRQDLSTVLPTQFRGWFNGESPKVRAIWSGVQGFTADHLPFVGEVPVVMTGRGMAGGEWICAGFNGAGMCQCWPSGEAVVKMMMGENTDGVIPDLYLVTEDRLMSESMRAEAVVKDLFP
jgi:glycine/D-amino acid oxidase-like deaminating enzyme